MTEKKVTKEELAKKAEVERTKARKSKKTWMEYVNKGGA